MSRQLSDEVRTKILGAALHQFSDKGYKETTVREIAGAAGIALGGLYPYFGSKEQLYVEVLKKEMGEYNERTRRFRDLGPEDGIRCYIENHFEYMASRKEVVSRHFKDYDLEFAKPIRKGFFDHQREFLEAVIDRGAREGVFAVADSRGAALFVLCLLKGSLFYNLAGALDLSRVGDGLCRQVLGLLKETGRDRDFAPRLSAPGRE